MPSCIYSFFNGLSLCNREYILCNLLQLEISGELDGLERRTHSTFTKTFHSKTFSLFLNILGNIGVKVECSFKRKHVERYCGLL